MVEELKSEMCKIENLIGYKGKVDVTSRETTNELIRVLEAKYKDDVKNGIRLNRLEFYHDLIENARKKQKKITDTEEEFVLADKQEKKEGEEEGGEQSEKKEEEKLYKPDAIAVASEEFDEWKNLLALSKIYYVLEHPNSQGLKWKRRIRKKKYIKKFTDKDLIEWRVAQNFQLKTLEEWALSRQEARKLADESPYDFDDLDEDDESRELEDMFHILDTQKQKKHVVSKLEKVLHKRKKPFRLEDEDMEDWTESYSDDSEESGAEELYVQALEIPEEPDLKIDVRIGSDESSFDEDETISGIFSIYQEIPKYKNPIFEEMEQSETMKEWYDVCEKAFDFTEIGARAKSPVIRIKESSEDMLEETGSLEKIPYSEKKAAFFERLDEIPVQKDEIQTDIKIIVDEAEDSALDEITSPVREVESKSSADELYVDEYFDDEIDEIEGDITDLIEEAKDEALDKTIATVRTGENRTGGEKSERAKNKAEVSDEIKNETKTPTERKDQSFHQTSKTAEDKSKNPLETKDEGLDTAESEGTKQVPEIKVEEVSDDLKALIDEAKDETLDKTISITKESEGRTLDERASKKAERGDKSPPKSDLQKDFADAVVVDDNSESNIVPVKTVGKGVSSLNETDVKDEGVIRNMRKRMKSIEDENLGEAVFPIYGEDATSRSAAEYGVKSMEEEELDEAVFSIRGVDATAKSAAKHGVKSMEDEELSKVNFNITKPQSEEQTPTGEESVGKDCRSMEDADLDEYKFDIGKTGPPSAEKEFAVDASIVSKSDEKGLQKGVQSVLNEAVDEALDKIVTNVQTANLIAEDTTAGGSTNLISAERVEEKEKPEVGKERTEQLKGDIQMIVDDAKETSLQGVVDYIVEEKEKEDDKKKSPKKK